MLTTLSPKINLGSQVVSELVKHLYWDIAGIIYNCITLLIITSNDRQTTHKHFYNSRTTRDPKLIFGENVVYMIGLNLKKFEEKKNTKLHKIRVKNTKYSFSAFDLFSNDF